MNTDNQHHSTLPPSSYPAWAKCPHWTAKPAGDEASIGTAQHALLAAAMRGEIDLDTTEDVSKDLLYPVRRAHREIKQLCESLVRVKEYRVETRVEGTCFFSNPFGTADIIAVGESNDVVVVDYKSFFTNKEYWEQLAFYAYAFALETAPSNYENGAIHLIVYYGDTGTYDYKQSTIGECFSLATHAIGNRTNCANLDRAPSPWCSLCAECGKCTKAVSLVEKSQAVIPSDVKALLTPDKIPSLLAIASELEKRIKALKDYAREIAEANGGVLNGVDGEPAYRLVSIPRSKVNIRLLFDRVRTMVDANALLDACNIQKDHAKELLKGKPYQGRIIKMKEIDEILSSASVPMETSVSLRKVTRK